MHEGTSALPAQLLLEFRSLAEVAQAGLRELVHQSGLSPSQAVAFLAACELGRRLYASPSARRPAIMTPADVVALLGAEMRYLDREHFRVLPLNTRHHVLAVEEVAVGGLDSAPIHPREVFKAAIRASAAAVILVHNHPSGDPEPSADDLRITARLAEAGRVVGIEVLDHVVVGDGRYVSVRERRAMGDAGRVAPDHPEIRALGGSSPVIAGVPAPARGPRTQCRISPVQRSLCAQNGHLGHG
ncbi:MAG: DNA repair protein RadC [bacterium]|nr:DNA repair protein RadC [bacterium]